ncbi:MAG: group 1 glycosyl transferase [Candidatus Gottesmanbacteria bacterium GW2011_GWA2_43_14]|uniref:Group 1 glycosyl transferase n=1 Tax=Candidatus Gottesmanbacteria bacterium GW2011_GWA2_43_14 TaxID=1618443 RepID=A0A0G1DIR9_9BACT|nr:MAG: group 1 glycosyl transferase [Candidatus Gottesmanbacteria bacterium GW2011_GWA2_43_14]
MRLLFTITFYSPYLSGLTLYVKRLAEAFSGEYPTTVLTFRHKKELPVSESLKNVNIVRAIPLVSISKGFLSPDFVAKCWLLVKDCDVVVINLPELEGLVAAIFGKLFRKKVISIYHCEVILPDNFINKIIQAVLNSANFLTLWLSESIVTYTDDFAVNSRYLNSFIKKVKTVYPLINSPEVNKRVQNIIIKKIGTSNSKIIGVAARLAAEKGIEYLLEAIPLIRRELGKIDFKIVIAGSLSPVGEESYKKKITGLAEKYKDSVIFLGEIRENKMGSFYSLIDILVLPSVNSTESFGMVQVEAMMMGVPVVVSDLPGVRQPVIITGMGVVVPPKNAARLASAIAETVRHKSKFIKPKALINEIFAVEKTVHFYRRLLSSEK